MKTSMGNGVAPTVSPAAARTEADVTTERVWFCKIGGEIPTLPLGADYPMRAAISEAFHRLTGHWPTFIFSGWGGTLDEVERAIVENRRDASIRDAAASSEERDASNPKGDCL